MDGPCRLMSGTRTSWRWRQAHLQVDEVEVDVAASWAQRRGHPDGRSHGTKVLLPPGKSSSRPL